MGLLRKFQKLLKDEPECELNENNMKKEKSSKATKGSVRIPSPNYSQRNDVET